MSKSKMGHENLIEKAFATRSLNFISESFQQAAMQIGSAVYENFEEFLPPKRILESKKKKVEDYWPWLDRIFQKIVMESDFQASQEVKKMLASQKKVISVFNHSTPLSWLPAVSLLADQVCKLGGGERVPLAVMDRYFFKNPIFRPVASFLTQNQSALNFDEILERLNSKTYTDFAVFPEGSNCFFGPGHQIQAFRSSRFIELSLKAKAPLILSVHRGSEDWALPVPVSSERSALMAHLPGWLSEKLDRGGHFVLPKLPTRLKRFRMKCQVYRPKIKLEELSDRPEIRRRQLDEEGLRVQRTMQRIFDGLDLAVANDSAKSRKKAGPRFANSKNSSKNSQERKISKKNWKQNPSLADLVQRSSIAEGSEAFRRNRSVEPAEAGNLIDR